MRLLLDEMVGAVVAEKLRQGGHDVVAVQDPEHTHLRGVDDYVLLGHAHEQRRAVVTDNVPDFFRCHQRRIGEGLGHHGLLLFTNATFPRHRHELFVSHIIAALERVLRDNPSDDDTAWIAWLPADS